MCNQVIIIENNKNGIILNANDVITIFLYLSLRVAIAKIFRVVCQFNHANIVYYYTQYLASIMQQLTICERYYIKF